MRAWQLFLLLALVALPTPPAAAQVTATPGFVSQTQYASCTEYEGVFDCGNTNNNVTVISLAIQPGLGAESSYIFQTVTNAQSVGDVITGSSSCALGGQCTVIDTYKVTVFTKPLVIMYNLQDLSLKFPFAYSAHYTTAFEQVAGDPETTSPVCKGEGINRVYTGAGNQPPPVPPSYYYENQFSARIGALFSWVCTLEEGPACWAYNSDQSCISVDRSYPNTYLYPNTYRCADPTKDFGELTAHITYFQPSGCAPQDAYAGDASSWVTCTNRVPVDDDYWPNNQQCPYFMFLRNGIYEYPIRIASPTIDYSICGNPAPSKIPVWDTATKNAIYPPPKSPSSTRNHDQGFDYAYNQNGINLPEYIQDFFAEPQQTQNTVQNIAQERCSRVYGFLNDQSPLRPFYGSAQYQGRLPLRRIQTVAAAAGICKGQDPETPGSWPVNPAMPGCGKGFSDLNPRTGVFPVDLNDAEQLYKCNNQQCGPVTGPTTRTRNKNTNTVLPCGTNDFYCGTSSVGNYADVNSGVRTVPIARCMPSDNCNDDRIGMIATNQGDAFFQNIGAQKARHYTAETAGAIGPWCRAYGIQPTAKPYFEATAMLQKLNPMTGIYEFVSNSTVSNVNFLEYSAPAPTPTQTEAASYSFNGRQGASQSSTTTVNNAPPIMNLEFSYFDTPNGQIAPDFTPGLNLIICNTTDSNPFIYMGDPNDPTANPWEKINADPEVGGKSGGYTPLAKNLWVVTSDGRTDNPRGSWFMFYDASKFGEGANRLGMPLEWFGDNTNAQTICSLPRYSATPGWIPGFDWTVQERITDQLSSTPGARERQLRDQVSTCTPCMIASYFQDYENQNTCEGFRKYNPNEPLRFLFPTWVAPDAGSTCGLPRCWLNGLYLFCGTEATTNNNIRAELKLAVLGTVLQTQTVIATGTFVVDAKHPVSCAVDQGARSGVMNVYVQNTGTTVGAFQVQGNCTGGVTLTPTVVQLEAGQVSSVTLNAAQAGQAAATTSCSLFLIHPTYTNVVFSSFTTTSCVVLQDTEVQLVLAERVQTACGMSGLCTVPNAEIDYTEAVAWGGAVVFFCALGMVLLFFIIGCVSQKKVDKLNIDIGRAAAPTSTAR